MLIFTLLINVNAETVIVSHRNLPKLPLIQFKKQNFCFSNSSKLNHFKEINSYFYQAAGIELVQMKESSKEISWSKQCTHLVKLSQQKKSLYRLEVLNGSNKTVLSVQRTLKSTGFTDLRKMMAEQFVPFLKKEEMEVDLNHDILKKAFLSYQASRLSLAIEILNKLKTMMEQKKFSNRFSEQDYKTYKSSLFQLALYYEISNNLSRAFIFYKLCLHHDLSNIQVQMSLKRVKQRIEEATALQQLLRKYE